VDKTSITLAGVVDTFLVLLIGIGPKLALVPFLHVTASLDPATEPRVLRRMLVTAGTAAAWTATSCDCCSRPVGGAGGPR
jgi:multiple antibiotic resistance protein